MKVLFLAAMLLASVSANAQLSKIDSLDMRMDLAGRKMQKFSGQATRGMALQLGGAIFIGAGASSSGKSGGTTMMVIGGGMSAIGFCMLLFSYAHINKAGLQLQGSGVSIDLKKSK